ncbi:uncharacterized protein LODBEIA_P04250 [Lodderomyces beijingensis]|uniref:tRNA dimethylallyltransferase n=1 Tax=Lodderomyces beijingensis TaxID=1775926 RepID=A0ABP0ZGC8_9ASCO
MSQHCSKKPIISIVGTTGVGKSQFSIDLAERINGEIINADSMQVYKGAEIITNKHPLQERKGVPHHLMGHVGWDEEYFIHRFNNEANCAIADIHSRGKIPIIVGGTHYYLQCLLFENKTMEQPKEREVTEDELRILDGPTDALFHTLSQVDSVIASKFHPQDHRKLRRALEIYYTTGRKPSSIYQQQKLDELESSSLKHRTIVFWLYSEMSELHKRLDSRVDVMMQTGAVDEIRELNDSFVSSGSDCTSGIYQVIGFKEFLPWLEARAKNPDEPPAEEEETSRALFEHGVERMKIRTRQYAKYQVKWIQKTLSLELAKESKFNYINGGRLCVLDATDLSQWNHNVRDRGIETCESFLHRHHLHQHKDDDANSLDLVPADLAHLLSNETKHAKSNKNLNAADNWKHFSCETCKDKNGSPFIVVGEEIWNQHLNSRRHRRTLAAKTRKRVNEANILKSKSDKENALSNDLDPDLGSR